MASRTGPGRDVKRPKRRRSGKLNGPRFAIMLQGSVLLLLALSPESQFPVARRKPNLHLSRYPIETDISDWRLMRLAFPCTLLDWQSHHNTLYEGHQSCASHPNLRQRAYRQHSPYSERRIVAKASYRCSDSRQPLSARWAAFYLRNPSFREHSWRSRP